MSGHAAAPSGPVQPAPGGLGILGLYADGPANELSVSVSIDFYFDESGKEPRSEFVRIAGVGARSNRWGAFRTAWRACCAESPSIAYFKMHEATKLKGEFDRSKGWTEALAAEKVSRLTDVFEEFAELSFSSQCNKRTFERAKLASRCYIPREYDYEYLPCFWDSVRYVADYMESLKGGTYERPRLVYDSQPECSIAAHAIFNTMKAQAKKPGAPFSRAARWLGSIAFEDDKKVMPLQAADLVAWHWNRGMKDYLEGRPEEPVLTRIRSVPFQGTDWKFAPLVDFRRSMAQIAGTPYL